MAAPVAPLPPLPPSVRLWGTVAVSAATFMNALDMSIANVSLPAMAGDLGVSPNQGTWVITSFAVANAIAVPLTGWLAQRFGQVRLFTASILLFVLASWLCALAPGIGWLIAARALQGFVAGPIIPLAQTLLLAAYPPALAGVALSTWSMTTLVAPVLGPVLGGWITDNVGWHWIFLINIPIGLAAAAAVWALFRHRESTVRRVPIDAIGLALLVLWVGTLQLVLDIGKEHDWLASPLVLGLLVLAAAGFAFFLAWELTEAHPVVDLRLFTRRNFLAGTLCSAIGFGLVFGNIVLLPLWLQQYMGYTATDAGMVLAPVGMMAILLSPFVGRRLARTDPRLFASFAFVVFAVALGMRGLFTTQADLVTILLPTVVQGIAMPFFWVPLASVTLSGLPPERIAAASGLSNFVRLTAGAFGASVATTLWESRAAAHHERLAQAVHPGSPGTQEALSVLAGAGLSPQHALAHVNRLVDQQAFMLAANDVFLGSAVLFLALLPLVWLGRPVRSA